VRYLRLHHRLPKRDASCTISQKRHMMPAAKENTQPSSYMPLLLFTHGMLFALSF
jgi:hypothetical protein